MSTVFDILPCEVSDHFQLLDWLRGSNTLPTCILLISAAFEHCGLRVAYARVRATVRYAVWSADRMPYVRTYVDLMRTLRRTFEFDEHKQEV